MKLKQPNIFKMRLALGTTILLSLVLASCRQPTDEKPGVNKLDPQTPKANQPAHQIVADADSPPSETVPLPEPITVYQSADHSVVLDPIVAQLLGEAVALNDSDFLSGFGSLKDKATWRIQIIEPGTYRVEVDTFYFSPTHDAKLRVVVTDQQPIEALARTSDKPKSRETTEIGEVEITEPGTLDVRLDLTQIPLIGDFSIAEVRLVPLEAVADPFADFQPETTP